MSRSYKKMPICGITCAESEKSDKKLWHSRYRSNAKQNLNTCSDYDAYVDAHFREYSNVWGMAKDGRQWMNILAKPYLKKYVRK